MDNLQTQEQEEDKVELIATEDDVSVPEHILRNVILAYQKGWNKSNDKNECKYTMTITKHKVATEDGNKDVAYLRLDRLVREKGFIPKPIVVGGSETIAKDEGWETQLIHQEVYFFRNIKEQVDPRRMWVEQLYMNCLARLLGGGLEYADLLRKMKNIKMNKETLGINDEVEERAAKSNLVIAKDLPKNLSKEDEEYKKWVAEERKKEGLA